MAKEEIDIRAEVRAHIARKHKTQTAAAKEWGVSKAYVSAVLRDEKPKAMPDWMALHAGFVLLTPPAPKPRWVKAKG